MTTFNLFQYDRLLLHKSDEETLHVIGEAASAHDTWVNHASSGDVYSMAYVDAISSCKHMVVDYKNLSAFGVVDTANFVPNLESLYMNDCVGLASANVAFANLVAFSVANTPLNDSVFMQLPSNKALDLIDISNTRNITHVPSANTINAGHSLLTSIDPAVASVKRLVANDARITSVLATDQTSAILWSYPGRTLTVTGATNNCTVFTPQAVEDVVGSTDMHVLRISYYSM